MPAWRRLSACRLHTRVESCALGRGMVSACTVPDLLPVREGAVGAIVDGAVGDWLGEFADQLQPVQVDFDAQARALVSPELAVLDFETLRQVIPDAGAAGEIEKHRARERGAAVKPSRRAGGDRGVRGQTNARRFV